MFSIVEISNNFQVFKNSKYPKTLSLFLSCGIPNSKQFLSFFSREVSEENPSNSITLLKIQKIFHHEILHNAWAERFNIPSRNFKINVMRNYIDMIDNCEENVEGVYDDFIEEYSELLIGNADSKALEISKECSEGGYF